MCCLGQLLGFTSEKTKDETNNSSSGVQTASVSQSKEVKSLSIDRNVVKEVKTNK
jgi:hypothetical protein